MLDSEKAALQAREAAVVVDDKVAGRLAMIATDEFRFTYRDVYVREKNPPISLTMPTSQMEYVSHILHPFFDNLLFEGEQLKKAERRYQLSRYSAVDRFKLLMVTGSHNVSTVSIQPIISGTPVDLTKDQPEALFPTQLINLESPFENYCEVCLDPVERKRNHSACKKLLWGTTSPVKLEAYQEDPVNIFKTHVPGQTFSGAQRKSLFSLKKNILTKTGLSTHILKPDGEFPEMPANEHLTMAIARKLGFNTPPIGLYHASEIGLVYVVKRFVDKNKYVAHEDFAQLSEEPAIYKDQATLEAVGKIISQYATSPRLELSDFFRRVLFCYLTGNGDMHLKNWSLSIYRPENLVKLSPVYDFLNVRASYPQEQVETILSMGGKRNNLNRKLFEKFADNLGLEDKFIGKTFKELTKWKNVSKQFTERSALSSERKKSYLAILESRYASLLEK